MNPASSSTYRLLADLLKAPNRLYTLELIRWGRCKGYCYYPIIAICNRVK